MQSRCRAVPGPGSDPTSGSGLGLGSGPRTLPPLRSAAGLGPGPVRLRTPDKMCMAVIGIKLIIQDVQM